MTTFPGDGSGCERPGRHRLGLPLLLALPVFLLLVAYHLAGGLRNSTTPPPEQMAVLSASPTLPLTSSPTATPIATATPSPQPTESIPAVDSAQDAPQAQASVDSPNPSPGAVQAKIQIVWPHDGAPVREANLANITAYLLPGTGKDSPPCAWEPVVRLWAGRTADAAQPLAVGQKRMSDLGGSYFPVWDFNDVDVSAARDPTQKLTFFVTVDGITSYQNVWVHAADARTIFPQPDVPTEVTDRVPTAVEARIQIVWPHDNLPIDKSALANVTAYLFEPGTKRALSPGIRWSPVVRLHWSLNADTEREGESGLSGTPRTVTEDGISFLAWDFNDVDIRAAQDPLNRIYFWVSVGGLPTFSNVWAHGLDARTIFPEAEVLGRCR
jgi:hypothetical protein